MTPRCPFSALPERFGHTPFGNPGPTIRAHHHPLVANRVELISRKQPNHQNYEYRRQQNTQETGAHDRPPEVQRNAERETAKESHPILPLKNALHNALPSKPKRALAGGQPITTPARCAHGPWADA